ncbi:MAG TPA: hypothetical protein VIK52_06320 [Opitutaceae bacterium]
MNAKSWTRLVEDDDTGVRALRIRYEQSRLVPGFFAEVATALELLDGDASWRAVWFLRQAADECLLSEADIKKVPRNVEASRHWAARLLLCQIFAQVECPESERETVFEFLVKCFADRRVIIRAWALSAMWPLRRDPRFRNEVQRCMRAARKDPGKAMQARLRHLDD